MKYPKCVQYFRLMAERNFTKSDVGCFSSLVVFIEVDASVHSVTYTVYTCTSWIRGTQENPFRLKIEWML